MNGLPGSSCENHPLISEVATLERPTEATLSKKQRRVFQRRERRKRKRQALAKLREDTEADQYEIDQENEDGGGDYNNAVDEVEKKNEKERELFHQQWLERERIAQEEFRVKKEKEEAAQRRKEEEEKRIREEWEEHQKKEQEEREQKEQEKRDREVIPVFGGKKQNWLRSMQKRVTGLPVSSPSEENEAVQKLLDEAESQLENGGTWKNPDAPKDYGTEKDKANCPFFLKTGACRFGDRCSRKHERPASSRTLMIRGMFVTFGMEQSRRDDYDTDASLEYSEEEIHQQFLDFYEDVLPEFKNSGKVVQFKVSCNFEPHLRGNVYVQYETEDQCKDAFMMFNGRWYAGRQLQCELSPVFKWKTAICGLFDRQRCPKGKHCNFLHVFRNPNNEFWEADRDLHLSPDRGGGFTSRHSERRDRMSQRGYSPDWSHYRRDERRRSSPSSERRARGRRRSNSRERQSHSKSSENWSTRSGRGSLSERRIRSRSRERHRSRSRSRDADRYTGGRRLRTNLEKKSSGRSESESPRRESKNGHIRKRSRKSDSKSPKTVDTASTNESASSHRHKRSKKNKKKKKSKKKLKRKRSKSCSASSSGGSSKESEDDTGENAFKDQSQENTEKPGNGITTADSLTIYQQVYSEPVE